MTIDVFYCNWTGLVGRLGTISPLFEYYFPPFPIFICSTTSRLLWTNGFHSVAQRMTPTVGGACGEVKPQLRDLPLTAYQPKDRPHRHQGLLCMRINFVLDGPGVQRSIQNSQ